MSTSVRKNSVEAKRCQKSKLAGILQIHLRYESRIPPQELWSINHFSMRIFLNKELPYNFCVLLCVTFGFGLQINLKLLSLRSI